MALADGKAHGTDIFSKDPAYTDQLARWIASQLKATSAAVIAPSSWRPLRATSTGETRCLEPRSRIRNRAPRADHRAAPSLAVGQFDNLRGVTSVARNQPTDPVTPT
jgi:hypothetical protein